MVIEELKAMAGFGAVKLEIFIPKNKYKLDESLNGKVLLSGGKVNQDIVVLNIRLIREWSWECYSAGMDMDFGPGIPRAPYSTHSVSVEMQYELDEDKGTDEVLKIKLGNNIKVHPDEKKEFPFVFNLSSIQKEKWVNEKWKLQARADIIFAKDAITEQIIELVKSSKARQR